MGFPGEKPCSCYLLLISWHFTPPPHPPTTNSEQIHVGLGLTLGIGIERKSRNMAGRQAVCL